MDAPFWPSQPPPKCPFDAASVVRTNANSPSKAAAHAKSMGRFMGNAAGRDPTTHATLTDRPQPAALAPASPPGLIDAIADCARVAAPPVPHSWRGGVPPLRQARHRRGTETSEGAALRSSPRAAHYCSGRAGGSDDQRAAAPHSTACPKPRGRTCRRWPIQAHLRVFDPRYASPIRRRPPTADRLLFCTSRPTAALLNTLLTRPVYTGDS